jgi:hypothetical protein
MSGEPGSIARARTGYSVLDARGAVPLGHVVHVLDVRVGVAVGVDKACIHRFPRAREAPNCSLRKTHRMSSDESTVTDIPRPIHATCFSCCCSYCQTISRTPASHGACSALRSLQSNKGLYLEDLLVRRVALRCNEPPQRLGTQKLENKVFLGAWRCGRRPQPTKQRQIEVR